MPTPVRASAPVPSPAPSSRAARCGRTREGHHRAPLHAGPVSPLHDAARTWTPAEPVTPDSDTAPRRLLAAASENPRRGAALDQRRNERCSASAPSRAARHFPYCARRTPSTMLPDVSRDPGSNVASN